MGVRPLADSSSEAVVGMGDSEPESESEMLV